MSSQNSVIDSVPVLQYSQINKTNFTLPKNYAIGDMQTS
jgi:hypothetical protein